MIAAAALSLALTATPLTAGSGWELGMGITHLDTAPWEIQFYDSYSRDRLTFYANLTAAELKTHTGVTFKVTTVINPKTDICPGRTPSGAHRIILRLDPNTTRSNGSMCNVNGAADSSRVTLSEYNWFNKTRNGSKYVYRRNVTSHEMAHSLGVGHPDTCSLPNTDPLMCGAYWGGYSSHYSAHKYTPYDVQALKRLVMNR